MPLVSKNFSDIITFTRASGATWFNSAGNLIGVDFSTSSNTIGTGSKTFTLAATAGVNRSWATGDSVLIVDQANSANNMTGAVTSYTASTQTLVVNVTSTAGSGTITSWRIGNLMQRLDYNPSTLAPLGFLIEEQRTNSIRNNTMQGAVAGTPGTLPTNWGVFTSLTGLTRTIVGTGTENGITYIDIRLNGTPSAAGDYQIYPESLTQVVAASGQSWDSSFYYKLQAGSLAGVSSLQASVIERDAAGAFLAGTFTNVATPSATLVRGDTARTLSNAATARVSGDIRIVLTGAAIDITLRIGLPQLEQGAFATSVIPTTTTALTRSADVASVNTLSPWFNSTEYTLYHEGMVLTNDNGIVYSGVGDTFDNTAYFTRTAPNQTAAVRSGAAPVAAIDVGFTPSSGVPFKMAMKVKANDFAFCVNGGSVATDTSGAVPVSTVRLGIGSSPWAAGGGNARQQWVRRITFYPRGLSSAELQAITA